MPILSGSYSNPTWISINLGGSCNSHCKFCYTEWTRSARDLTISEVKDSLQRIRNVTNLDSIVITGGEPTLRKDLVEIFKFANKLGFNYISLQTHARELVDVSMLKRLVSLGLNDVLVSLHGPNASVHDTITCSPGSFQQAINALKQMISLSVNVTINIVMCNENYKHLKNIVGLLDTILLENRIIRFSFPILEGAAFDNIEDICVPFKLLRPILLQAIAYAKEKRFEVQTFGMPLCITREYATTLVNTPEDNSRLLSASVFNRDNIPRGEEYIKLQICKQCSVMDKCAGIQIDYLRLFPDSYKIFVPFLN